MIKNIFLKNLLINTVFRAASAVNRCIPKNQHKVLLYANEGFRDNIMYLSRYMVGMGYDKKYKIICACDDYRSHHAARHPNVKFVSTKMGMLHYFTSKAVYYCFGRIPIVPAKGQAAVQMWHGTSFKGFDQTMQKTNSIKNQFYTHVFASSEFFRPIVEKKFACAPSCVYICGHPRTDCFYYKGKNYDLGNYKKVIIWMPTFRKSEQLGYADTDTDNIVPYFRTEELPELDKFARDNDVLLLIKFHPMQDIGSEKLGEFTNIRLYTHKEFTKHYDLYGLLKQTDALITDYSSVFYDYLLLDKPIGFTEDDEEQYASSRGFAVDDPDAFKPGMRIRTREDLLKFISDTAEDIDEYKAKRKEINDLANQYQDGRNCERALKAGNITL